MSQEVRTEATLSDIEKYVLDDPTVKLLQELSLRIEFSTQEDLDRIMKLFTLDGEVRPEVVLSVYDMAVNKEVPAGHVWRRMPGVVSVNEIPLANLEKGAREILAISTK